MLYNNLNLGRNFDFIVLLVSVLIVLMVDVVGYYDSWVLNKLFTVQIASIILLILLFARAVIWDNVTLSIGQSVLVFVAGIILVLLYLVEPYISYKLSVYVTYLILLIPFVKNISKEQLFALVAIPCLIDSTYVILQYLNILNVGDYSLFKNTGFFNNPDYKSMLYSIVFLSAVCAYYNLKNNYYFIILIMLSFSIGIGGSRSTIITIIIGFVFLFLFNRIGVYSLVSKLLLTICASVSVYTLSYYLRFSSVEGRFELWKDSLKIIENKLLFGYGLNSFEKIFNEFRADNNPLNIPYELYEYVSHPHNEFISIAVEYGLVGLVVFSCILFIYTIYQYKSACSFNLLFIAPFCLIMLSLISFPLFIPLNIVILSIVILYSLKNGYLFKHRFLDIFRSDISKYIRPSASIVFVSIFILSLAIGYSNFMARLYISSNVEELYNYENRLNSNSQKITEYVKSNWYNILDYNTLLTLVSFETNYKDSINYYENKKILNHLLIHTTNPLLHRLIGEYLFREGDYESSATSFEYSHQISTIHVNSLFEFNQNIVKSDKTEDLKEIFCKNYERIQYVYSLSQNLDQYSFLVILDNYDVNCSNISAK